MALSLCAELRLGPLITSSNPQKEMIAVEASTQESEPSPQPLRLRVCGLHAAERWKATYVQADRPG